MTGRPVAALTESVARQIVREHNGNRDRIAVALAEEVIARGGWKASTCQPLLRAFELAAPSPASPAETAEENAMNWRLDFTCCEYDDGSQVFTFESTAREMRESYLAAFGHRRTAVLSRTDEPPRGWRGGPTGVLSVRRQPVEEEK